MLFRSSKSMNVFMQFLLSHSVQEMGRRRRYVAKDYGKHLAGLLVMEACTQTLIKRFGGGTDDKWIWEKFEEDPVMAVITLATRMPMLGSYAYLASLIRMAAQAGFEYFRDESQSQKFQAPSLYESPSEGVIQRGASATWNAYQTIKGVFGG